MHVSLLFMFAIEADISLRETSSPFASLLWSLDSQPFTGRGAGGILIVTSRKKPDRVSNYLRFYHSSNSSPSGGILHGAMETSRITFPEHMAKEICAPRGWRQCRGTVQRRSKVSQESHPPHMIHTQPLQFRSGGDRGLPYLRPPLSILSSSCCFGLCPCALTLI